jgi:hypothetical protein
MRFFIPGLCQSGMTGNCASAGLFAETAPEIFPEKFPGIFQGT